MSDTLSAAFSEPVTKGGRVYERLLDKILEQLSDEDRATTENALTSPNWSNGRIARVLTKHGYPISEGAIRNWRIEKGLR